jgi:hypothetical protein
LTGQESTQNQNITIYAQSFQLFSLTGQNAAPEPEAEQILEKSASPPAQTTQKNSGETSPHRRITHQIPSSSNTPRPTAAREAKQRSPDHA